MFDIKKLIAGAASGFLAAFVVDINAWSKSKEPFDWQLAVKRWVAGAIAGASGAFGVNGLESMF
jgi:hypothetical protein